MNSLKVFKLKSIKQISMLIPLRTTRGARSPYHQVAITYAQHVCSQQSFGRPLRINGPFECIERKAYSVGARMPWLLTSPAPPKLSLLLLRMLKQWPEKGLLLQKKFFSTRHPSYHCDRRDPSGEGKPYLITAFRNDLRCRKLKPKTWIT